jgi:YD repeat-containing protein
MKRILLCAPVFVIILASCSKTSKSGNSNTPAFYLSSATTYTPGTTVVDSFSYDSSNHVSQFSQFEYDTVGGTPSLKTWSATFTPTGTATPPPSYTYTSNSISQTHSLSYDGQGRITRDTCATTGYVAYYSYPNGNIATTVLFNGSANNNQIDTIFVSNGNASAVHSYVSNSTGTADSLVGSLQFGFSSTANPLYHSALTTSIGPLLYTLQVDNYGGSLDPISVNAFNSVSGTLDGFSGVTLTFSLINDAVGRLNVMSASLLGNSEIIYFKYY